MRRLKVINTMYNLDNILIELARYGLLVVFFIYFWFSIILIRQAQLMSRTLIAGFNKYLILFVFIHLFVFVWFAYLVISLMF